MTDNEHIIKLLLTALRLPGRLNAEQAAVLLGFPTHDIPVLHPQRACCTRFVQIRPKGIR